MKSQLYDIPIDQSLSPPSRGAWIEITLTGVIYMGRYVAPLAGGVD